MVHLILDLKEREMKRMRQIAPHHLEQIKLPRLYQTASQTVFYLPRNYRQIAMKQF